MRKQKHITLCELPVARAFDSKLSPGLRGSQPGLAFAPHPRTPQRAHCFRPSGPCQVQPCFHLPVLLASLQLSVFTSKIGDTPAACNSEHPPSSLYVRSFTVEPFPPDLMPASSWISLVPFDVYPASASLPFFTHRAC